MVTRVVILHGMPGEDEYFSSKFPSGSNSHWIPWLQKQLVIRGFDVQTPEVINAYKPDYPTWRSEFERHLVGEPMVLVGHSCGGGFLVRWLSEHPEVQFAKLVLVAPWLDPDRTDTTDFFDFTIDPLLSERAEEIHVLHSTDDYEDIGASVATILKSLPTATEHRFTDKGHFVLDSLGTDAVPEVLAVITG